MAALTLPASSPAPTKEETKKEEGKNVLALLIDISGSMQEGQKWPQTIEAVR
jgi:hypothetical protein